MTVLPWLAIDGGQSQIRLRLSTGAQAQADGVQHRPGGNVPGILASVRTALADLGNPRVQVVALGMSGLFQEPGPLAELGAGVVDATGAERVLLAGDDITGHAGALRGQPGVVAAIGTGTAVLGLTPAGQFHPVDGRGYLLGDDGSGLQLGRRGLRAVLEHAEGLHEATALTQRAVARYGPVDGISHSIYRADAPVAAVAEFAQDVIATAREGDASATGLVRAAMHGLARSIRAAAPGFGDGEVPVVVVGGLTRSRDVLSPVLTEALAEVLPAARLRDPAGTGLDGAAWLARHDAGPYAPKVHAYPPQTAAPQGPTTTHAAGAHRTRAGGPAGGTDDDDPGLVGAGTDAGGEAGGTAQAPASGADEAGRMPADAGGAGPGVSHGVAGGARGTGSLPAGRDPAPVPGARMLPIPAGGLVVSCQAPPGSPLAGESAAMVAMARAAEAGGAVGIRAEGATDVAAIAAATPLPIIGLSKSGNRDGVYITPTLAAAEQVVRAGAVMVAVDGTDRPRPGGLTLAELIAAVHDELGVPVMADCDSMASATYAAAAGADVLATTLSGYTGSGTPNAFGANAPGPSGTGPNAPGPSGTGAMDPGPVGTTGDDSARSAGSAPAGPDLDLLTAMCRAFDLPVIAEGRYYLPEHAAAAFAAGAYAVVVGSAITDPVALTRAFAAASPADQPH